MSILQKQQNYFRPFLVVPAEEEEVTNINTNPFILVDPGVAEAARCLGAVNFSNLDRYKLFSQLTSYLITIKESKNKPRISPKFHKQPSHNCCLTTHPDLKQRCRETNLPGRKPEKRNIHNRLSLSNSVFHFFVSNARFR